MAATDFWQGLGTRHRFLVADQCLQMGITPHTLILEPLARNTAPAIAAAALRLHRLCRDGKNQQGHGYSA